MLDGLSEFETYRGVVKDAQEPAQAARAGDEANRRGGRQARDGRQTARRPDARAKGRAGNLAHAQSQVGKGLQNLQERMNEMAGRLPSKIRSRPRP